MQPADWPKVWSSRQWRTGAEVWVRRELARRGMAVTGEVTQPRIRFWSTQLVFPTDHGPVWFKENNPGQRFEAAVLATLAELAPTQVVAPLATDPERGWLLTTDHGNTVAAMQSPDEAMWTQVLGEYADLQQRVARHGEALQNAGLERLTPDVAVTRLEQVLAEITGLADKDPLHLSQGAAQRVARQLPRLRAAADSLAAGPVPMSLEHNDLHPGNAFVPRPGESQVRFFDFGDAIWGHPFSSLYVAISVMGEQWGTTTDDPRIQRAVAAYLEAWDGFGDHTQLRRLADLAVQLAPIQRFWSWYRLLRWTSGPAVAHYAPYAMRWLDELSA